MNQPIKENKMTRTPLRCRVFGHDLYFFQTDTWKPELKCTRCDYSYTSIVHAKREALKAETKKQANEPTN